MWPDGICRVTDTRYTKTIQYQDINYQLSQNEDKTAIFEAWCDFLNYFDSSVQFQLSFVNLSASQETFARSISIPPCGDEFDSIRAEYAGMLQNQLARGNNGLIKTKYLTFGVEADNLRAAKPRLERIETDLLNNFKRLGVVAAPLNGFERLHVMHDILRMDEQEPFRFSWDWLAPSGLSTKDFIAPSSFEFKTGRMFRMGKKLGAISFVQILAPELNDRMLADFLDMESSVLVNLHVQSVDQVNAIKTVKRKITDLDKSKIEEQKKAVRAGYDMDIIPSDLATYGAEAKKLLQDLQSRNERMFLLTFLILNTADTPRQLDNNIFQTSSITQKYNCALTRLDFQQEEGLMSSLPLGLNQIEIQRGLTTSSVAIFVPFTTQELFQNGSEALYYGINALSNNLIMVDRKLLKNPNGLILGTPGSGKSFSAKREITNAFLICPKDDIIICDPEGEYTPLVERLHGQVIKLSPTGKGYDGSPCYINPMDLNLDYSDDDNPLSLKSDFILSLCELIVGGKDGLAPVEKTIIDRCVRIVYRDYLNDPKPENMPLLEDLYNALRAQDEKEAQYIATALEIYVTGSLNVFNHHTNVDVNSRIVCYDIKELGKQLKKIGMLVVQDQVWNRVTINRAAHKTTRYYLDEFHLLLKEEQTASYSVEIWKRYRKWGGIPTGITQNVKDLLSSREVENIFENSDFIYMLNVRQKLIDAGMPPEQIAFIHDANTEVKKRELFAKVRSGQVRVLMGSTAKMGAGTNVQDRLVALHDLDCPWRPRDLTQRKGRIERQGNQNKLVHVCHYVTEGTFDAYLWQTVENKQKFISQIMTSKSPVRSCEDVDATALSFAEIKALCAGDPRIKERMDLDIEVSKLKIMKADHNSKQFRLEDSLLKYFPEKIEEHKGFVRGLEADMQTLAAHPLPAEGFVGMEIRGDRLTDKENAGAALLDTCKEVKGKDPVQIGSYRGFTMSVAFDSMWKTYTLTLKGQMTHRVELGSDARGNLVRIENALDKMPERLRSVQEQLENLYNQQAASKAEVGKPFPQEQELAAKTARLIELDMELNLDGKGQPQPEQAIAKSTRPSVLDRLKAPPVHGAPEKPHKKEMEAR